MTDEEGSAEDYGYLSDSDLEDDEDEKSHSSGSLTPLIRWLFPPRTRKSTEEYEEHVDKGKVVEIPDIAFVT